MEWLLLDPSERRMIEEIANQSDRGAALIAGSYLEKRLEDSIKSIMWATEPVYKEIFEGTGPLATFSAKINVAYALGLYPKEIQEKCHLIRRIRNEFAHEIEPWTFNTESVRNRCRILSIPKFLAPEGSKQEDFDVPSNALVRYREQLSSAQTNRERYIAFVVLMTALLASTIMQWTHREPKNVQAFSSLYRF